MTQNEMVKKHLEMFGSITAMEAIQEYGIMRLASRISDLKRDGFNIESSMETGKNRFGKSVSWTRYEVTR